MSLQFPDFKPLELADRETIQKVLWAYQARISELTFSNLYIWRHYYRPMWTILEDHLIILAHPEDVQPYFLPPVGPSSRNELLNELLFWLSDKSQDPRIERADKRLIDGLSSESFTVEPQCRHFDYVYLREALVNLSGRKYHSKKNHINFFRNNFSHEYQQLTSDYIPACKDMAGTWCTLRRCEDDMSLSEEWEAVNSALDCYSKLELSGGVILVEGSLEAFSVGEMLNSDTVVVHVEKANPEIRGLYPFINQQCCEHAWGEVTYVNREQDLGEEGLRRAKQSYHPDHMVEKFVIRPA